MITKEQYLEIINLVKQYVMEYRKTFPDAPMSSDFCAGIERTIDLIQYLVEKD